jgi:outer membrane lipoprotein LolB
VAVTCVVSGVLRSAVLAGTLALLIVGCATAPVSTPSSGRAVDPHSLTQWTAKGRIALTAQGEGGSGSFVWQQRSERTELAVRGPLGAGGLSIVTDGATLQLDDGSGQPLDGDAARAALERRLGARLPLSELRYWMLGVPAPETMAPAQPATGSVAGFTQAGWVITYEAFQPAGNWSLPARLTATTGDARVRIVVDDWQLPPGR